MPGSAMGAESLVLREIREAYVLGLLRGGVAFGRALLAESDGAEPGIVDGLEDESERDRVSMRTVAGDPAVPPLTRAAAVGWVDGYAAMKRRYEEAYGNGQWRRLLP